MNEAPEYDEKQLADRDAAFRYGFCAALFAIILNYLIADCLELPIFSDDSQFLFCLGVPTFVLCFTMIAKNAYDGVNGGPGRIASLASGATGLFLTILGILRMTGKNFVWFDGTTVNDWVMRLLFGLCLIALSLFYWIEQKKKRSSPMKAISHKNAQCVRLPAHIAHFFPFRPPGRIPAVRSR